MQVNVLQHLIVVWVLCECCFLFMFQLVLDTVLENGILSYEIKKPKNTKRPDPRERILAFTHNVFKT